MRKVCLSITVIIAALASMSFAQPGPYQVLKKAKVGGAGNFDYVYADAAGRRLYIPRMGNPGSSGSQL